MQKSEKFLQKHILACLGDSFVEGFMGDVSRFFEPYGLRHLCKMEANLMCFFDAEAPGC